MCRLAQSLLPDGIWCKGCRMCWTVSIHFSEKKNHYSRGMFREVLTAYQLIMPTRHREYSSLQKPRKRHVKAKAKVHVVVHTTTQWIFSSLVDWLVSSTLCFPPVILPVAWVTRKSQQNCVSSVMPFNGLRTIKKGTQKELLSHWYKGGPGKLDKTGEGGVNPQFHMKLFFLLCPLLAWICIHNLTRFLKKNYWFLCYMYECVCQHVCMGSLC